MCLNIFERFILFPTCIYVRSRENWYPWRPEEDLGTPRAGVTGRCELLSATQVLCKSKCVLLTAEQPLQSCAFRFLDNFVILFLSMRSYQSSLTSTLESFPSPRRIICMASFACSVCSWFQSFYPARYPF